MSTPFLEHDNTYSIPTVMLDRDSQQIESPDRRPMMSRRSRLPTPHKQREDGEKAIVERRTAGDEVKLLLQSAGMPAPTRSVSESFTAIYVLSSVSSVTACPLPFFPFPKPPHYQTAPCVKSQASTSALHFHSVNSLAPCCTSLTLIELPPLSVSLQHWTRWV